MELSIKEGRKVSCLVNIIRSRGLSQKDVARRTGVKYKTVNRQCITGIKTPRVAKRYAAVLCCDWRELLD